MSQTLQEKLDQLGQWTNALYKSYDDHRQEIIDTLAGKTKLPDNCPSKEAMALLILNQYHQKLDECNAAFKELYKDLSRS